MEHGNLILKKKCMANGANVNSRYHENGYSALMFAALSGK
jgi:hypothetical protein